MEQRTRLAASAKISRPATPGRFRLHRCQPGLRRDRRGVPTMLNKGDEQWLCDNFPGLIAIGDTVAGTIEFKASYDPEEHRFVILGDQLGEELAGKVLSGTFQVRIQNRTDKSTSQLPAVYIDAIEPIPDRHFGQRDNSACLCSPFDEREFLQPE